MEIIRVSIIFGVFVSLIMNTFFTKIIEFTGTNALLWLILIVLMVIYWTIEGNNK